MKNRVKIILILCVYFIVISVLPIEYTLADTETLSSAKGMVVLEGNTDTILYSQGHNDRLPMASTTKIMTAIVCIENCNNLNEKIVVSDNCVGIEGTSIYLQYNEELSVKDLLYGLILASGNDCAVAIAEFIGGTEAEFVSMMNNKAIELGLSNTHFDNPHGLDSDTHYTSAYDLAIITSYALKNQTFRDIVSTERIIIDKTNVSDIRYLKHKNKLMFQDDNCIGVKTGFTDNAGRCLVSAYDCEGMLIISVVLNCQPMFEECDRLTKMALDNYTMKQFIKPYNYISSIDVSSSNKNQVGLITIKGYMIPVLNSELENYSVEYDIPDVMAAPIGLNQPIGNVKVLYNDEVIYSDSLYSIENLDNTDIKYQIDNIINRWF